VDLVQFVVPVGVFIYLDGLPENCRTVVSIEGKILVLKYEY
jgi:hypothetical protein